MVNREIIREIWLRDGYYSEEILTKDELKKYKEECMRLFEEKSESPYKHPTDDSEMLVDLLKHPRVVELVEICMEADLNEDVKVDALQDWMYLKPPGSLGRDVHQDIFYTHANRGEIINTSIHLNSADKDNGGLFVYPGSQNEHCQPIQVDEDRMRTNPVGWNNERGKPCFIPGDWVDGEWVEKYEKVYTDVKEGSVLLLHSHLIHGSEKNESKDRWRTSFLTSYLKRGSHYNDGDDMSRKRVNVYE